MTFSYPGVEICVLVVCVFVLFACVCVCVYLCVRVKKRNKVALYIFPKNRARQPSCKTCSYVLGADPRNRIASYF